MKFKALYGILEDISWSDRFIVLEINNDLNVRLNSIESAQDFKDLLIGDRASMQIDHPNPRQPSIYIRAVKESKRITITFNLPGCGQGIVALSPSVRDTLLVRIDSYNLVTRRERMAMWQEMEKRHEDNRTKRSWLSKLIGI